MGERGREEEEELVLIARDLQSESAQCVELAKNTHVNIMSRSWHQKFVISSYTTTADCTEFDLSHVPNV